MVGALLAGALPADGVAAGALLAATGGASLGRLAFHTTTTTASNATAAAASRAGDKRRTLRGVTGSIAAAA